MIINAGRRLYLLLAGMERISVELGQFVLAGEPVAMMGEKVSRLPLLGALDREEPVLYVEFRKEGNRSIPPHGGFFTQSDKVRG